MTEREMWEALAGQLEPLAAANEDAAYESLAGAVREVEDPEFFYLLAASLSLDKHERVADVRAHPHYPATT